jgi:hypothetical protein
VEKAVGNQPGNTSNIGHVHIPDHATESGGVLVEATSICIKHAIVHNVEVIVYYFMQTSIPSFTGRVVSEIKTCNRKWFRSLVLCFIFIAMF